MTKNHLPVYGVGPFYGTFIIALTVLGIILSRIELLSRGDINQCQILFIIIGIFFVITGLLIWFPAAFGSRKIDNYIVKNNLCTDGIYGIVRNPCYSGIMFACTGVLIIAHNLFLLVLPFIYWLTMTILMKETEEIWLSNMYGQNYVNYCKRVNRCIPWFSREKE